MPPAAKPPISIPADQLQDAGAAGVCVLTAEHECQDTEISSAVTPEHSIFAACHLQTTALMDAALQFDSLCWTDANTAAIIWDSQHSGKTNKMSPGISHELLRVYL